MPASERPAHPLPTLLHHFLQRVPELRRKTAYTFLDNDMQEVDGLTYAALFDDARRIAAELQKMHDIGERVALLFPVGLDFVRGFFGCLFAGLVAVPIIPPRSNKPDHWQAVARILTDAEVGAILTTGELAGKVDRLLLSQTNGSAVPLYLTEHIHADSTLWRQPAIGATDLAFLQYTSGSTGNPKGVMVSHGNLMHNEAFIKQCYEHDSNLVLVGWLPFYHDMGLIGNLLQTFYCGGHAVLMSPMTFLRQPLNWLQAISTYRATTSGGPNFAYQLCVDRITPEQLAGLDLSCWQLAFTGAEPVRGQTLDQFAGKFALCGIGRHIFHPGYGMAETTLLVTASRKSHAPSEVWVDTQALSRRRVELVAGEGEVKASRFISAGHIQLASEGAPGVYPIEGQKIRIVEPEKKTPCQDGEVGEIWIHSGSVAQGYYGKPQLSTDVFHASLEGDPDCDYLRTGDLGFIVDGHLYISGRLKDLVIIRGQNYAPEDIEATAYTDSDVLQFNGAAAFSIDGGGKEQLILLHEVQRTKMRSLDAPAQIEKIRQAVLDRHQIYVDRVVLVKPASLPKTSSGKIRRHRCKEKFMAGEFVDLASSDNATTPATTPGIASTDAPGGNPSEADAINACLQTLVSTIRRALKSADLRLLPDTKVNTLGLDSLRMVELHFQLEKALEQTFELDILFNDVTLLALARQLVKTAAQSVLPQEPRLPGPAAARLIASPLPTTTATPQPTRETAIGANQQGLLYVSQTQPDIPVYNIPVIFRLKNHLDLDVLQEVLIYLINRHDMLRSHFRFTADTPKRVVTPGIGRQDLPRYFETLDASTESQASLCQRLRREAQRPFALEAGPLVRIKLYRCSDSESVLLMTSHHIVMDLSSLLIVFDELFQLYSQALNGKDLHLPPPACDYDSYVQWQQAWLQTPVASAARQYWKEALSGDLPVLNLPKERPRPATRDYTAASFRFALDADLQQRLSALARRYNTSLYTVLLSAYQVLLCRLGGQREVVVGSPTSAHGHPAFANLVGYCLNPVILRANLEQTDTFAALLSSNRDKVLNALRYQYYPLQDVLREVRANYPGNIPPYFQTLFYLFKPGRLTNAASLIAGGREGQTIELNELTIEAFNMDAVAVEYDLNVWLVETEQELLGEIAYNASIFTGAGIEQLVCHYQNILRGIVANPDSPCARIDLLDPAQYRQIMSVCQGRRPEPAVTQTIHGRFQQQVRRTPSNTALSYEGEQLSYAQLENRANQLAHYIRLQRGADGQLIGLCMPRGIEMVVGILGILKAGCAYVPLDPDYPAERLQFIVRDSGVRLVLTQQALSEPLSAQAECRLVFIDSDRAAIDAQTTDAGGLPGAPHDPQQPAYVIYTSGSTGTPKGVVVSHGNVISLFNSTDVVYRFSDADKWTLFHSFAFDFSVWEIWGALFYGAELLIVPYWVSRDSEAFYRLLIEQGVTVLNQTPSAFRQLLEIDRDNPRLTGLRYVIFGGEALDIPSLNSWFNAYPRGQTQLINMYGITETTVHSSYFRIPPPQTTALQKQATEVVAQTGSASIIGRPLADTDIYVLDELLQPVPVGVSGEMYIGGPSLSLGYLNRPELTAQRFIDNPFAQAPHEKLYKTGDLARINKHGLLEFLGRTDDQVKIRGFRIELEEIETALNKETDIHQAVVLARSHAHLEHSKVLVAYIVLTEAHKDLSRAEAAERFRSSLKRQLPEHMVPGFYVFIDAFPLTPSGKIDKQQLLAIDPQREDNQAASDSEAAGSGIETILVNIWSELFQLENPGINTSFFELGGDSLMSNKLLVLAKEQGVSFTLQDIFHQQTIKGIAAVSRYDRERSDAAPAALQALVPDRANRYRPFPLTDIQQAYWLGRQAGFDLGNIGTHSYQEVDFSGFDIERFTGVWNRLIARHDMLRMVVNEEGQQQVLETVPYYQIAVDDLRELDATVAEQRFLATREALSHQVFSGGQWPLFDIRISLLSPEKSVLHISVDMLTLDAASGHILIAEIADLYNQADAELPDLTLSFRDYVLAEHLIRETEQYADAKAYWQKRLATLPLAPEFPLAVDPATIVSPRFERRQFKSNSLQWSRLKDMCRRQRTTPTVFLLSCISEVFYTWSKQDHFSLNLTLFNRLPLHAQVNDIIGDFTSLTILEVDYRAKSQQSFFTRVNNLHQQLWRDLEHKYYSGVEVQRDLSRAVGKTVSIPIVVTSALGFSGSSESSALRKEMFERFTDTAQYGITQTSQVWLDIQFSDTGGQLCINWDSVAGLFSDAVLDQMFEAFCGLLARLCDDDYAWAETGFPLLPPSCLALIRTANDTCQALAGGEALHQPLLQQIERLSEKVAVQAPDKALSYGELGKRSAHLATQLLRAGAERNTLVAVVMAKGWQQVVAVTGILRSGAAYLPIDATLPAARIRKLLELGEVKQVVTVKDIAEALGLSAHFDVLTIDAECAGENESTAAAVDALRAATPSETDIAYVIFTSGSTGEPKGVVIDHRGARNTVVDINRRFHVRETDKVLGLSNLAFDLSVYDIFGVLGAGGTLVLPRQTQGRDPQAWFRYVQDYGVTLWNTVPALMGMFVEYAQSQATQTGLRLVLMSGDWIPVDLPGRIRRVCAADTHIISLGGATEASIWSVYHPIENVDPHWSSIPYGKPLANQATYVLKPDLSPCPTLVAGDLYIEGVGLAQGYWRDRDKTDRSFITHPQTRQRLYRTGDLARRLPDGNLEFLGRSDFQVKIHGHRVELGEIENRLLEHEQIQEAVVKVFRSDSGAQKLVAYVTNAASQEETVLPALSAAALDTTTVDTTTGYATTADIEAATQTNASEERIVGAQEKLQFKLAQHSVRHLQGSCIQLPLNSLEGHLSVSNASDSNRHSETSLPQLSLAALGRTLRCFYRKDFSEYHIPKAYYPSAGSLYPVQVYLEVAGQALDMPGVENEGPPHLAAGYYYYHPLNHQLIRLGDSTRGKAAGAALYLVADHGAIQPLYGDLAEKFCVLEAGYMGALLESSITNTCFDAVTFPSATEDFFASCQLNGNHRVIAAYHATAPSAPAVAPGVAVFATASAVPPVSDSPAESDPDGVVVLPSVQSAAEFSLSYKSRKSYREYQGGGCTLDDIAHLLARAGRVLSMPLLRSIGLDLYLHIHTPVRYEQSDNAGDNVGDGTVGDIEPGYYRFDTAAGHLTRLQQTGEKPQTLFPGQDVIEQRADFAVFIVADQQAGHSQAQAFWAGYLSQLLNQSGLTAQLGLCAIGHASDEAVQSAFSLADSHSVIHGLVGGKVTAAQMHTLNTESSEININEALREFLAHTLPDYMIPSLFIPLDRLPLTENGKVDRNALPTPNLSAASEAHYEAPATDSEKQLTAIWSEVLKLDKVGINDNFFDLGGNSMDVVAVKRIVKEKMDVDVPMAEMFSVPTVAALAQRLATLAGAPSSDTQRCDTRSQQRTDTLAQGNKNKRAIRQRRKQQRAGQQLEDQLS